MNNKLSDVYEDTYKIPFDYEIPKDKEVFPRAPPDELVFKLSMEVTRVVHQPIYYRFFELFPLYWHLCYSQYGILINLLLLSTKTR